MNFDIKFPFEVLNKLTFQMALSVEIEKSPVYSKGDEKIGRTTPTSRRYYYEVEDFM